MQVSAAKETCAVSSLCVYRVPTVFDQDEDGAVEILDANPPEALREAVLSAARACPTKSIQVD
jgi:ferredoxin